jgi:hypothetical protein
LMTLTFTIAIAIILYQLFQKQEAKN